MEKGGRRGDHQHECYACALEGVAVAELEFCPDSGSAFVTVEILDVESALDAALIAPTLLELALLGGAPPAPPGNGAGTASVPGDEPLVGSAGWWPGRTNGDCSLN